VNTEKIEFKPKDTDVIMACPHCKVCSIVLSAEEYALMKAGQQLVEVCQVCGKNVYLDRSEKH
jgi:predicted  nucleic acid-binding Zn-ribbon protein